MDSDNVWTKVPNGVDPDSPILCAPSYLPIRTAAEVEAAKEKAITQAPTCAILEEAPHRNDNEDA